MNVQQLATRIRLNGKPIRIRRSKYVPHHNTKECARRLKQLGLNDTPYVYTAPEAPVVGLITESDELTIVSEAEG